MPFVTRIWLSLSLSFHFFRLFLWMRHRSFACSFFFFSSKQSSIGNFSYEMFRLIAVNPLIPHFSMRREHIWVSPFSFLRFVYIEQIFRDSVNRHRLIDLIVFLWFSVCSSIFFPSQSFPFYWFDRNVRSLKSNAWNWLYVNMPLCRIYCEKSHLDTKQIDILFINLWIAHTRNHTERRMKKKKWGK